MIKLFYAGLAAALFLSTACSPSQVSTATKLEPVATAALANASPATVSKIAAVSQAVVTGIAATKAGAIAAGADAATLAQIDADQALAQSGQKNVAALAANDAAPVTATNSGDSTGWELSLLNDAVQVAGVVLPLVL